MIALPCPRLLPLLLTLILALQGCASVNAPRDYSEMLPAEQSAFGRSVQAQVQAHHGQSGFRLLSSSD